eukprot:463569-Prymnesium_polylepis.1
MPMWHDTTSRSSMGDLVGIPCGDARSRRGATCLRSSRFAPALLPRLPAAVSVAPVVARDASRCAGVRLIAHPCEGATACASGVRGRGSTTITHSRNHKCNRP